MKPVNTFEIQVILREQQFRMKVEQVYETDKLLRFVVFGLNNPDRKLFIEKLPKKKKGEKWQIVKAPVFSKHIEDVTMLMASIFDAIDRHLKYMESEQHQKSTAKAHS